MNGVIGLVCVRMCVVAIGRDRPDESATDSILMGGTRWDRGRLLTIPIFLSRVARWTRSFSRSEIPCLPDSSKKKGWE